MQITADVRISRRAFLGAAAGIALAKAASPLSAAAPSAAREFRLVAAPGRASLAGAGQPETAVWTYGGQIPGPEIRVRQGDRVRILVENRLPEETSVHWHGVRVPNAMDGVPFLTQKPIGRGETFPYEFDVPDAGSYWYHPHYRSFEQAGRGLYGLLIVEERDPPPFDRDIAWMLGDWRLGRDGQIVDDFGNRMDAGMGGRIGNTVTVNGRLARPLRVRAGERIRLRLFNSANARIFGLVFRGHRPVIIALDGQPVAPHEPASGRIVLGPAMRVDVMLDMTGAPGERFAVRDTFYPTRAYSLGEIVYADEPPLSDRAPGPPPRLAPNTMPEPDLGKAERHEIDFGGGMGGGGMGGGIWTVNGQSATGHAHEPFLSLKLGSSYVLAMRNNTSWHHPIHFHGHSFRVIARNGRPTRFREWQDTVFMDPDERVEIAFVADNPGGWMIHCHILEHMQTGLMGVIRVG
jgi:FtsP/CotA-like multicopper oxidase with cupredoxin domain